MPATERKRTPMKVLLPLMVATLLFGSGVIVEHNKWLFIASTWFAVAAIFISELDRRRGSR